MSLSQDTYGTLDRSSLVLSQQSLSSSWNSLVGSEVSDLDSDISPYAASQVDVFGELPLDQAPLESVPAHQYQLSYELALDNVLTPFAAAELPPSSLAFQSKRFVIFFLLYMYLSESVECGLAFLLHCLQSLA